VYADTPPCNMRIADTRRDLQGGAGAYRAWQLDVSIGCDEHDEHAVSTLQNTIQCMHIFTYCMISMRLTGVVVGGIKYL
jgi:hypothetical protein